MYNEAATKEAPDMSTPNAPATPTKAANIMSTPNATAPTEIATPIANTMPNAPHLRDEAVNTNDE